MPVLLLVVLMLVVVVVVMLSLYPCLFSPSFLPPFLPPASSSSIPPSSLTLFLYLIHAAPVFPYLQLILPSPPAAHSLFLFLFTYLCLAGQVSEDIKELFQYIAQ